MVYTDPCMDVICSIAGEVCFDGECKCGGKESCEYHSINATFGLAHYIRGDVFCDPSDGLCKCKDTTDDTITTCSAENRFCTVKGCKCSQSNDEYIVAGESQGTCKLGSDRCYNAGPESHRLCDGK